jgi:acyl-CoA reductase-like NAD-dependent aldehyde dehydrogenase
VADIRSDEDTGTTTATLTIKNPATGQALADVPSLDREGTLKLVRRARAAQARWESLGFRAGVR